MRPVFYDQSMLKEDEFFKEISTSFPNASVKDDDSNVWGHCRDTLAPSAAALIGSDCANPSANTSTHAPPSECQIYQTEPHVSSSKQQFKVLQLPFKNILFNNVS